MKTLPSIRPGFLRAVAHGAAFFAMLISHPLAWADDPPATPAAAKDHVLFVGTDLSVKQDEKFYKVVGATKKALKIEKDHSIKDVRLSGAPSVKINKGVKLSNRSATISKVQTESVDRVSAKAQLAAMQASMALSDEWGDNEDRLHGKMTLLSAVAINRGPNATRGSDVTAAGLEAQQAEARANYLAALPNLDNLTTVTSTMLIDNIMHGDPIDDEVTLDASALPGLNLMGGAQLGDGGSSGSSSVDISKGNVATGNAEVELTFDVSSPEPLENAYIVVVANYASLTKPNEVARQISAQEFARIDSQPKKVKMTHAAAMNRLPFKKFDIALFANGQEIATNLSEKRMGLTADQAYQFFLIDYLRSHKGATVPPTPMLMTPRTEFRRQVEKTETNQTIHASVDKTGKVLAISTDAAGKEPVPAAVDAALQKVRFMPALEKGIPVDGHLKMRIADLIR
jgi:hypothetical protein